MSRSSVSKFDQIMKENCYQYNLEKGINLFNKKYYSHARYQFEVACQKLNYFNSILTYEKEMLDVAYYTGITYFRLLEQEDDEEKRMQLHDDSEQFLDQSLQILESFEYPEQTLEERNKLKSLKAKILLEQGQLNCSMKYYDEAEEKYEEALMILQDIQDSSVLLLTTHYKVAQLMIYELDEEKYQKAKFHHNKIIGIIESNNFKSFDKLEIQTFRKEIQYYMRQLDQVYEQFLKDQVKTTNFQIFRNGGRLFIFQTEFCKPQLRNQNVKYLGVVKKQ